MKRLLCRLFGHRWTIKGLTGRYEWCGRCRERREMAPPWVVDRDGRVRTDKDRPVELRAQG